MLISPPFLPERNASESEADWIERAMKQPPGRMANTNALEGSFPVSAELQWHNGLHIEAPQGADGNPLPVRAVADGEVVFVNLITPANTENRDPQHAQNYLPDKTQSAWTDNGCIVLKHKGEIGADGTHATSFTYYSLYMHLRQIKQVHQPAKKDSRGRVTQEASDRDLAVGDRIYRKDELGLAGKVYGLDNRLHFEIALGEDALGTLLGKTWKNAPAWQRDNPADTPTADGRADSVFGSVYIYLRADTPASTQAPTGHMRQPSHSSIGQPLWLRIDYDKGQCSYQSFNARGEPTTPDPVAEAQPDYEYNLYTEANKRHNSLGAADQANSSPSGWYELLRFGRNLGPDRLPAQAAHWRQIPGPSGRPMWVDLNAKGSCKFSDADFLPIAGWNCYHDDSNPKDQRCDSDKLKARIREAIGAHVQGTAPLGDATLRQHLGDEAVRRSMRRAICDFPTEWDTASIQIRYQWQRDPALFFKLDDEENWERFVKHLKAVTFDRLPQGYKGATWHVHPMQFIAHMRKCGWLSEGDLKRLYPNIANSNLSRYHISLNQGMRKYGINTPLRTTIFLGQGAVESAELNCMVERGTTSGSQNPEVNGWYDNPQENYFNQYKNRNGNIESRDHTKFRGRGLKQLTGRYNYGYYWVYRGWIALSSFSEPWWNPPKLPRAPLVDNPQEISVVPYNTIDAGGWYWEATPLKGVGPKGLGRPRSTINTVESEPYSHALVEKVTRLINGGITGLQQRQLHSDRIFEIIGDLK